MPAYYLIFLVISILFRVYFECNVGLIDDEAYHWTWSQMPSLSYYDHPGMIAWLEYISTSLMGSSVISVRLPSFLCYLGILYFTYKLADQLFGRLSAQVAVFIVLWSPFWGFGGHVASPETPFMLAWVLGSWVFWQGVKPKNPWSLKKTWIALGLIMGCGLNSKFIISLLALGFGVFLLASPEHRKKLLSRWPWIGFLIATALCLPIFMWNQEYGWPSFIYQFHDRHTGETFSIPRWLGWWAAQWAFMTPFVYFMILIAFVKAFRQRQRPEWKFILYLALPSLVIFYIQPFFADYKPHWSGSALWLFILPLGKLWQEGIQWRYRFLLKPKSLWIRNGVLGFFILFNVITYVPFAYPIAPKIFSLFSKQEWKTTYDLSNEFYGWEELGKHLLQRKKEIHWTKGQEPFLGALRYETTAQTWWGTKEKIYMLNDPRSHYTVLQDHHQSLESFKGKEALVVTPEKYYSNPMDDAFFDRCTPEEFKVYRHEVLARTFTIWDCENFQGVKTTH